MLIWELTEGHFEITHLLETYMAKYFLNFCMKVELYLILRMTNYF